MLDEIHFIRVVSLVIIILILVASFFYKRMGPAIGEWKSKREDRLLQKLLEQKAYNQISTYYRKKASRSKAAYRRDNELGLAKLYDHQPVAAIQYFRTALQRAIGEHMDVINNNLAIAYLQNGDYREAIAVLEDQREKGYVSINPYILGLIIQGRFEEAKAFFHEHIDIEDIEDKDIQKLLNVNIKRPETLTHVKELYEKEQLWLYHPVLKYLIEKWELEIFYVRTDRYEKLMEEGRVLLSYFDNQVELFTNPTLRFFRSILALILPRIGNYHDCASLYGLINGLDSFSRQLPLSNQISEKYEQFFKKVYYIFYNTRSVDSYDEKSEELLIHEQCPADAKPIVTNDFNSQIYISQTIDYAIRYERINDPHRLPIAYVDLIEKPEALKIKESVTPILDLISQIEPKTKDILISLVDQAISEFGSISSNDINEILLMIPIEYHDKFKTFILNVEDGE
ncbi:tetratricopeptide repeat protein [Niallia oryzisoli]|uniref:tetratricopeptide repeat protein n=1 Tax=Niallia oryzisoli TaxID=1737571 RepID=UPI003734CC13